MQRLASANTTTDLINNVNPHIPSTKGKAKALSNENLKGGIVAVRGSQAITGLMEFRQRRVKLRLSEVAG